MGFEETSLYCPGCDRQVLARRPDFNHLLHFLLLVLSGGLWAVGWYISASRQRPWRCSQCGREIPLIRTAAAAPSRLSGVMLLSIAPAALAASWWLLTKRASEKPGDPLKMTPPVQAQSLPATEAVALPQGAAQGRAESLSGAAVSTADGATANAKITLREGRISIQTAATRVCEAAGLTYDWRKSFDNTGGRCKAYISVEVTDLSVAEALDEIVVKNGLKYRIENGHVWLER